MSEMLEGSSNRGEEVNPYRVYRVAYLVGIARERHRRRKYPGKPDITSAWFREQIEKQGGVCYFSRIPLVTPEKFETDMPFSPSVDRLNPSLGYTRDNCVISALCVNRMRSSLSLPETYIVLERIKQYA